ncbi:MAG: acyl-ACP--UDP-N-acetylglucosamine O-acyltransferase [Marinicaulis sp.]|nr:acyl-ACP--UDP-N-acetylglucosamine O-acyltransferase [Marinicaulis sp.]
MSIHPTAIVESGAELGAGVEVGAFCHLGPKVRLHDGVKLVSHVVIDGDTEIGEGSIIHPFTALGGPPQHVGYKGEETKLIIGANSAIREHVSIHRGTAAGGGVTRIGDGGFYMVGVHIAHDCKIGDNVILAPNVAVGGHVAIDDNVFVGGLCAIHQNCRIGAYAFIGGGAVVVSDMIPYASAIGNHARLVGLNIIGMKRRGMARKTIHDMRAAYRMLFSGEATLKERIDLVRERYGACEEIKRILEFVEYDASRPLMPSR